MGLHLTLLCDTDKTRTHAWTTFNKPPCILQKRYHHKMKGTRGPALAYPLQRHEGDEKSERKRWWRVRGGPEEQEGRERERERENEIFPREKFNLYYCQKKYGTFFIPLKQAWQGTWNHLYSILQSYKFTYLLTDLFTSLSFLLSIAECSNS